MGELSIDPMREISREIGGKIKGCGFTEDVEASARWRLQQTEVIKHVYVL